MNRPALPKIRARRVPHSSATPARDVTPRAERNSIGPSEIDLLLASFRLRARMRAAWLQKLWNEEGGPGGHLAVTHAEIATHLADLDSPAAEAEWQRADPQAIAWRDELARVETTLASVPHSRLGLLNQIFNLSAEAASLLQACAAVACDPSLTRVCAYLNDHAGRPFVTEALAARLYGYGRCGIWNSSSSLFRWELIVASENGAGEPGVMVCDPQIRDWLRGRQELDEVLIRVARYHAPRPPLPSWPIATALEFLQHVLGTGTGRSDHARIAIVGPRGSGRRTFAAALSNQIGLALVVIDADAINEPEWPRVFMRAQRQAYLNRCAVAWIGETVARRRWPREVLQFPLQFVICETSQELPPPGSGLIERTIKMPAPNGAEREALWLEYVPAVKKWPRETFANLVEQYRLGPGDIANAGRAGAADARQAILHAREAAGAQLNRLAQRLECPFGWDDLVLSEPLREVLRDIEFEARHRLLFWEKPAARRLFPQGRGLLALFSGAPGTGKTMAAQVIAAGLGYDLYRINLAAVVSKWVGETSQNLERILSRAAEMDVILLFDEADALFGKRAAEVRDAQDRFANTDTAYLLQAIESYDGIALLTTNQKGNIDSAFLRRLRFVVEFPKPDAAQQDQLWRNTLRDLAGVKALETLGPVLRVLSGGGETTGAQIKNAVLGSLFISQREGRELSAQSLLRGLERELSKEGRALSARERERILQHGH